MNGIEISLENGKINIKSQFDKQNIFSNGEYNAFEKIKGIINDEELKMVRKSENYATITTNSKDLVRLKITNKTKWISFFVMGQLKEKIKDDARFIDVKNKNQFFWKVNISTIDDILKYIDVLEQSYFLLNN